MAYDLLNKVAGKMLVWRSEPLRGGLLNDIRPQYLPEPFYSDGLNVDLDDETEPSRRDGYVVTGNTLGALSALTFRPSGGLDFYPSTGANRKVFMAVNGDNKIVYATSLTSAWVDTIPTVDAVIDECKMIQAGNMVLVLRGSSAPVGSDDTGAATVSGLAATDAPANGVDAVYLFNRIWLLVGSSQTYLYYSISVPTAAGVIGQWAEGTATTGGRLVLAAEAGNVPVAMTPWNQQSLIVFFNRCIEEVAVDPGDPYSGSIRRIIEPYFGCSARDSVVSVGQELFFQDQFGQIRSLLQTVNAEQAGVSPDPLSRSISAIIPGRLTMSSLAKTRGVVFKNRLLFAVALDGLTEAFHVVVYNLAQKRWEGLWKLPRAVRQFMVSNIRGQGDELYYFDGTVAGSPLAATAAATKFYRFFNGAYTDDGAAIPWSFTTRALDGTVPESNKLPEWVEFEFDADAGATITAECQVDEDGTWQSLGDATEVFGSGGTWITYPLTYPILPPLTSLTRALYHMPALENSGRGRFHRFRVGDGVAGKQVALRAVRYGFRVENFEMEEARS